MAGRGGAEREFSAAAKQQSRAADRAARPRLSLGARVCAAALARPSVAMASLKGDSDIFAKLTSNDKDYRYMATSDLLAELNKETTKLDEDTESRVTKARRARLRRAGWQRVTGRCGARGGGRLERPPHVAARACAGGAEAAGGRLAGRVGPRVQVVRARRPTKPTHP